MISARGRQNRVSDIQMQGGVQRITHLSEIGVSVHCRSTTFLDVLWSVHSVHDLCTMYRGRNIYKPLCVETHRPSLHPHTEP